MLRIIKVIIMMIVMLICSVNCDLESKSKSAIHESVVVESGDNRITNATITSNDRSAWMGIYQDELYFIPFYPFKGPYNGWLCKFGLDGVQKVAKLNNTSVVYGMVDSYLYYNSTKKTSSHCPIMCYDFTDQTIHEVYSGKINYDYPRLFIGNEVYLPIYDETYHISNPPDYVRIKGKEPAEITTTINGETIGEMTLYKKVVADSVTVFNEKRAMIQTKYGTVMLGYSNTDDKLFILDTDGQVISLFSIPCMWYEGTITAVDDSIYLSFVRYEKYGDWGMLRYENDTLEGTYRISLKDYSVEKLNGDIYNGLYYFGGSYIFACDRNGNMYRLNLDGSVKDVLYG